MGRGRIIYLTSFISVVFFAGTHTHTRMYKGRSQNEVRRTNTIHENDTAQL